jgi:hypothetical protein
MIFHPGLPIIKDLAAEHVASHAPAVLVTLFSQPVMAEHLGVKVVRLIRRVVYVELGPLVKEEAVVIHLFRATVQPKKGGDVDAFSVVYDLHKSYIKSKICTAFKAWKFCYLHRWG